MSMNKTSSIILQFGDAQPFDVNILVFPIIHLCIHSQTSIMVAGSEYHTPLTVYNVVIFNSVEDADQN